MAFGLADDQCHRRVSPDYFAEANPRLDIWMLLQCGALVEGAITELAWGDPVGGWLPTHKVNLRREAPNLWIDGTQVVVVWD